MSRTAARTPARERQNERQKARLTVSQPSRDRTPEPQQTAVHRACGGHDLTTLPVGVVRPKLTLSIPGDPFERQADAMAARVVSGVPAPGQAAAPPVTPAGPPRLLRKTGPPSAVPTAARGPTAGGGRPLHPEVRARIEPHLGTDLSTVRVRTGPDVDVAAASIGARAFTLGGTIHLTSRESPNDLRLMAHEATHVVQQRADIVARRTVMRQTDGTAETGSPGLLDTLVAPIRALPGYTLLVLISGTDPLSRSQAPVDRDKLIAQLLSYGPFGPAASEVLRAVDVVGEVFGLLSAGLVRHRLTAERFRQEFDQVWSEVRVLGGARDNLAVAQRHLDAVLADVRALVAEIGGRIIELVRRAAVAVVEPLLATPQFQPVWELAKKVLHFDPLRGVRVEAEPVDILADFMRLIGEDAALDRMRERGTLQQTADWLAARATEFTGILGELRALFGAAWTAIQPQNLPNLLTDLRALAEQALALVRRIGDFGRTVLGQVVDLIKKSLLGLLSQHAHQVPGFLLLTMILGRNPFTGEQVPRTAENLIKGFILLLPDGEATYEQLASTGVIAEGATRIETAMAELGISGELITKTFRGIWDTLSLKDLADPVAAFVRVIDQFGEPLGRLVRFAAVVVEVVLQLVLTLLNFPSELLASIQAHVTRAIADIKRDPVAFLRHMAQALKEGFAGFFANIGTYLQKGLADWLFRGLRGLGITIPTELTAPSVLRLVLDVLGVGVETLWTKLGERIGPERVAQIRATIDKLSGAWTFVKDVQERGISALWDHLGSQLGNLWDTLLGMARDWIMTQVVDRVVTKLLSMLDPTGVMAVVNGFIAFFSAVQSAIEYLREILQIVDQYVSAFADLAAGNTTPAARKIEDGLANAVPVAIGFLANQVGLGNIPEKAAELVQHLRALVDQALNWLFDQAMRLLPKGAGGSGDKNPAAGGKDGAIHEHFDLEGEDHEFFTDTDGRLMVASENKKEAKTLTDLSTLIKEYLDLPATASHVDRRRVIRKMIAIARKSKKIIAALTEKLGDPPNLGNVAPHGEQSRRFQPRSGKASFAPLWELESEHVIPRDFVSTLCTAHKRKEVTDDEYRGMHTILIYKGAADLKTEGKGDLHVLHNFAAHVAKGKGEQGRKDAVKEYLRLAGDAEQRAVKAVKDEHAKNHTKRGTDKLKARPTKGQIGSAAALQRATIDRILRKRGILF
ncbi:DUF4157 domain-containing protein [Streptomyces scabiei]|uniref:eCIS core domain-containing protein n=1 Tax=Streptomyces scabiei TaxID=1930 RepID=UPI0038F6E1F0